MPADDVVTAAFAGKLTGAPLGGTVVVFFDSDGGGDAF